MANVRMRYGRNGGKEVRVRLGKGEAVDVAMARWLDAHAERALLVPHALPTDTERTIRYDVTGLVSLRDLLRTRLPDDEELLGLLEDLLHALELKPWAGCRAPSFVLDARWVFVDAHTRLRLVCVPLEHVVGRRMGSVLELLRLVATSGLGKNVLPRTRVMYERLHAYVLDQGGVFSLNSLRAFVVSFGDRSERGREGGIQKEGLVLKNEATGVVVPLQQGHTYVLGRDEQCEVRFAAEPKVSRAHARLRCERDGLTLTDTDSTNGTFVEGRRLLPHRATHVGYGQSFALCNVSLSVERG